MIGARSLPFAALHLNVATPGHLSEIPAASVPVEKLPGSQHVPEAGIERRSEDYLILLAQPPFFAQLLCLGNLLGSSRQFLLWGPLFPLRLLECDSNPVHPLKGIPHTAEHVLSGDDAKLLPYCGSTPPHP